MNHENDMILIFEDLDIADKYLKVDNNMVWGTKFKKDKKYVAGSILMICLSASGELLWTTAV